MNFLQIPLESCRSTREIEASEPELLSQKFCTAKRVLTERPITPSLLLKLSSRERSHSSKDIYQHIHRSKLPTLVFQESLPTLPIPKLENTTKRFLNALKPIVGSNEYIDSENAVKEFLRPDGWGERLQTQLNDIEKECPHSNYLCQLWLDKLLACRLPLPVYCNPVILLEKDPTPGLNKQDLRSTNLLISSLRFMKTFRDRWLRPEVVHPNAKICDRFLFRTLINLLPSSKATNGAKFFNAIPVDMSQFRSLFNFSRIPGTITDTLYQDERRKHVVVIRRGHFFAFDVLDNNGNILNAGQILSCIRYIISMTDSSLGDACHSIATLTTLDRNMWAAQRKQLREYSSTNAESLQKIESALFVLALDTGCSSELESLLHSLLCGNGVNRWYDKSFNLAVDENGEAGICYEQSWGDGVAIIRYINEIYKDSTRKPQVNEYSPTQGDPAAKVKKLEFCYDETMKENIHKAQNDYSTLIREVQVNAFSTDNVGTRSCLHQTLNPDAMMQIGLQVAHHRLTGTIVPMYEPCSTATFKFGRTEVIRPTTMETKEICESLNSGCPPSLQTVKRMLTACSLVHGRLMRKAMMGQGFDRHLFALHIMAEKCRSSSQLPQLFQDMGYLTINCNSLSSCHLASPYVQGGAYGSCHRNGLNIGYMLQQESFKIFVTSYKGYTNGNEFVNHFQSALEQLFKKNEKLKN